MENIETDLFLFFPGLGCGWYQLSNPNNAATLMDVLEDFVLSADSSQA